jgi:cytochrome c nitrite reductase small subunit
MREPAASTGSPPPRRPRVPLAAGAPLALLFGGVFGIGLFTASYAEGTSYLSDDPASCRNCHVMNEVYDAWSRGPHREVATCNDCHTPHDFVGKWTIKALNGWNHSVAFTLQNFHQPIRINELNRDVALNNCEYCHGGFVTQVNHAGQPEREDCIRCHATTGHDEMGWGQP